MKVTFTYLPNFFKMLMMNDIFSIIRNLSILFLVFNGSFTGEAKAQGVVDIKIESVSVEMDGSININYTLVDESNQVDDIKIRYYQDFSQSGVYVDPDVFNSETLFFNNLNNDFPVNTQSVSFQLEAWRDNNSVLDFSHIHSSLFFDDIESTSDNCLLAVQASWSNYAKYPRDLSFQFAPEFDRLYIVSYEHIEDECINRQVVNQTNPITPLMGSQDAELIFNRGPGEYCFRLQASNQDNQTATSNRIIKNIDDFDVPIDIEILSVNVLNNEAIEVQLEVDDFGFSDFEYRLYRSDKEVEDYREIGRMDHSSSIMFFVDNQVPDFSLNPWYYHAKVDINECPGKHTKSSGISSSVFLEANVPDGFDPASANEVPVSLSWKHLPEWDQYELFSLESTGVTLIETFNAPPYEYSHQINIEGLTETVLSFRLEATKGSLKVHSNIAQVRIEPILFPPRASGQRHALLPSSELLIDGEYPNRFFRPTFVFPYINYTMNIFDRNGQLMFSTNDDSEPWDGNINGQKDKPAPAGAYVFEVRLTDIGGTSHQKKGVVYLIR